MGHNTPSLILVVRDTQDVYRTVKLPIDLVPGLGRDFFSTASFGSSKRCQNYFHYKAGFIVDPALFSIHLTRSDNLDHFDLTTWYFKRK